MTRNEVEETTRLMRSIAAHRESAERYRLAWKSARGRARDVIQHWTSVTAFVGRQRDLAVAERDEALKQRDHHHGMYEQAAHLAEQMERERDEARAEVVQLGRDTESLARRLAVRYEETEKLRETLEWVARAIGYDLTDEERAEQVAEGWAGLPPRAEEDFLSLRAERDDAWEALEAKRNTVRRLAESCALAQAEVDSWRTAFGENALDERTAKLRAALTEDQVQGRIERIKQTAAERIEARQVRAALDEERIEPERLDHDGWRPSMGYCVTCGGKRIGGRGHDGCIEGGAG